MENNRQFELMRFAARQKLEGADPVQLSVLTGLCWDGRTFDTETLGIPIRISWPECQISPALEMWHDLTILQYLANTKGTTLMGKFLALSEFRSGGLAKGTSFDRDNDRIISRIGLHDPQAIREAAAKLGGTELQEKSDLSFLFSFLAPHSDKVQFVAAGRRILCFRKNPFRCFRRKRSANRSRRNGSGNLSFTFGKSHRIKELRH